MKVLVTGATGFIGRHVVSQLVDRGHQVTALVRNPDRVHGLPWQQRVRLVTSDIDAAGFDDALDGHDACLHLAWPGLPDYQAHLHFESTLPAHYAFLKRLLAHGLQHLLVAGTCFEYGVKTGCLAEETPTDPGNPYAIAKDTLRKFLQALQYQKPFTLQWARLFYMFGPGQNPNSLLARLDRAIRDKEASFDMTGGEQLRDYMPVEEVSRSLVDLLEHPSVSGLFNVCSGTPVSVRTLVERRLAESGATLRLNLGAIPYSSNESMAFWGDNRRLAGLARGET